MLINYQLILDLNLLINIIDIIALIYFNTEIKLLEIMLDFNIIKKNSSLLK